MSGCRSVAPRTSVRAPDGGVWPILRRSRPVLVQYRGVERPHRTTPRPYAATMDSCGGAPRRPISTVTRGHADARYHGPPAGGRCARDPGTDPDARSHTPSTRAWDEAIRSGALPGARRADARPPIEVERPADPAHGDLATNLAMKLARPYRRAPLEIATLLAAKLVRDAGGDGDPSIVEAAEVAPPGFINIRLRPDALERHRRRHPRRAGGLGPGRADPAARRQRRVRVGQPDRPADHRQRARRVHRRPAEPGPRGRRPARHARVLLQRLGRRRSTTSGASVAAIRRGEPVPGGRLPGRLRRATSRAAVPDDVWAAATADGADTAAVLGHWAAGAGPGDDRGQPRRASASSSTSGRARPRSTRRAGSSGRSSGCAPTATSTSRTARCGSARPRSATTRTG